MIEKKVRSDYLFGPNEKERKQQLVLIHPTR